MLESEILKLRVLPKVFPHHPYARRTAGLGAGETVTPTHSTSVSGSAAVKVIGIYCSRSSTGDHARCIEKTDANSEETGSLRDVAECHGTVGEGDLSKRHIYIRVQFDKTLVVTLPLEVMREKYPQVLIDYLLSTAVWT